MIATCADAVQPMPGDPYSACANVVWEVPPSLVPMLSTEAAVQLAGVAILLWAVCWAGVFIRRAMRY